MIILATKNVGTGIWGGSGGAALLRQPYQRLECEEVPRPGSQRLNGAGADELADFRVDLPALQSLVEDALRLIKQGQKRDMMEI